MHYELRNRIVFGKSARACRRLSRVRKRSRRCKTARRKLLHYARQSENKKTGDYDDYKKAGERLDELSRKASEYGVSLCLENVEWAFYNRPGFFKEVKKYAPLLKCTLDVKQARLSGYDYGEYLDEMQSDVKTVHLSDVTVDGKIRLPGKGIFDFEQLFRRLKGVGFNGDMLIEVYKNDYNDVSEISQSLDYLRELKYKIF